MAPRKQKVIEETPAPIEEPVVEQPVKKVRKVRVKKPAVESEVQAEVSVRPATPKPKKTSKWLSALKEYNKGKERYIIPKKGTGEYDEVRKMMESLSV